MNTINQILAEATTKGEIVRFAALGDPIAHSQSPRIHTEFIARALAAGRRDLRGAVCKPILVKKGELAPALELLWEKGLWGINLLSPHKADAMNYIVDIDPIADELGAINILVRAPEGWKGYNTDYIGLNLAIQNAFGPIQGPAVILGAGVAAKAAVRWALDKGLAPVLILNRSAQRLKELLSFTAFKRSGDVIGQLLNRADQLYGALSEQPRGLLIQASGFGLMGEDEDASEAIWELLENLPKKWKVFNMVYGAASEPFVEKAKACGLEAIDGISMLELGNQAAFELFSRCLQNS